MRGGGTVSPGARLLWGGSSRSWSRVCRLSTRLRGRAKPWKHGNRMRGGVSSQRSTWGGRREWPPVLYALHVLAAVALLLQSLPFVGGFLYVSEHVGHQRLLQPLPDAVHQLLLFPTHAQNRLFFQPRICLATKQGHWFRRGLLTNHATSLAVGITNQEPGPSAPPDVLVRDDEGLAERLGRVQPHAGVLLHGRRQLAGDGGGAGVQGAGDGRQESLIGAAWADAWGGGGGGGVNGDTAVRKS